MFFYDISYILMYVAASVVMLFVLRGFFRGEVNGFYFLIPVFVIMYILPSVLDAVGQGVVGFYHSRYASEALSDDVTAILYNFYVTAVLVMFYVGARSGGANKHQLSAAQVVKFLDFIRRWRLFVWAFVLAPGVLVIMSGDIGFYNEYADRDRSSASFLQLLAAKVAVISMPLIALFVSENLYRFKRRGSFFYLLVVVFLMVFASLNCYIHGKRSVVAIFVFCLLLSFFVTKVISRKALASVIIISILCFGFFLFSYGKNIETGSGFVQAVQGLRIDFSRDYGLKFTMYHELLNENHVLPYRGASYFFLVTSFIPRSVWIDKPYPYAVYFTNSFFGNFGGDYLYGWGLTTSFVAEAVSNLGWLGLVFFPIFYIFCLKRIDKQKNMSARILGYMIMVLLLAIQPVAAFPLILAFLMMVLFKKKIVFKGGR
tara:strand:+ start:168 stop:1454 length:1287 start_codon:yes stop_codon:yes gene_type:complete